MKCTLWTQSYNVIPDKRTEGGRILNFKRALHRYAKERYYLPAGEPPANFVMDISQIGRFDQLTFGSCTMNAWSNLYDYRQVKSDVGSSLWFHPPKFKPASRMYGYRKETEVDGDPGQDNGSYLHTGAKVVSEFGMVSEMAYPYIEMDLENPAPAQIDMWAQKHKLTNPSPIQVDSLAIRSALSSGNPIVFGMPVYNEFENLNSSNYILPMPSMYESPLGGHANMLYGYETVDGKVYYHDLNSWGSSWGNDGTCLISEEFVLQFFSDLWTAW